MGVEARVWPAALAQGWLGLVRDLVGPAVVAAQDHFAAIGGRLSADVQALAGRLAEDVTVGVEQPSVSGVTGVFGGLRQARTPCSQLPVRALERALRVVRPRLLGPARARADRRTGGARGQVLAGRGPCPQRGWRPGGADIRGPATASAAAAVGRTDLLRSGVRQAHPLRRHEGGAVRLLAGWCVFLAVPVLFLLGASNRRARACSALRASVRRRPRH